MLFVKHTSSFRSLFYNRPFMLLWQNQFCLQLSYALVHFTFLLWVYDLTRRNSVVSWLLLVVALPSILFSMYAGVIADRVNRKYIIQTTDILLTVLFFSFFFVGKSLLLIFVLAFVISVVSQFFLPAEAATIPSVVPKEYLMQANSLFSLTIYTSLIIGYSLAGPIINLTGHYFSPFFCAGVLTLIASVLFTRFPSQPVLYSFNGVARRFSQSLFDAWSEILHGLSFIFRHRIIISALLLLTSVQTFVSTASVLFPEYVFRVLQIQATHASVVMMLPLGLGLISGALFNGFYGKYFTRRRLIEISVIGVSVMLFLFAFVPMLFHYFVFSVFRFFSLSLGSWGYTLGLSSILVVVSYLLGFFNVCIVIPAQTVLQEHTPESLRGRVFGVLNMLMYSLSVVPVILVGLLSDVFGTIAVLTCLSILIFIVGLLFILEGLVSRKFCFKR